MNFPFRSGGRLIGGVMLVAVAMSSASSADENLFGYVTGADTLPKGAAELYQWVTHRVGKHSGTYSAFDLRTEFEYGVLDSWSTSLYLNFAQHTIRSSAPSDPDTGEAEYPDRSTFLRWQGIQWANKYNFLSVYQNPVGFSLYAEPGYSRVFKITGQEQDEWSLELKFILQKNFLDDQLILALNISPEFEIRKFAGEEAWEREFTLEASAGISYRFVEKWFGGLEARYHSEYPNYESREHWAMFLGPNVHYGSEKWWATLTVFPQIIGGPRGTGAHSGLVHLSEHEKMETRLKVGYNF